MRKKKVNMAGYDDTPSWLEGACPDCPDCGIQMCYNFIESKFRCPQCGRTDIEDLYYDDHEEYYGDTVDDEPECCKACGGPYPDCMTSCKIFDD